MKISKLIFCGFAHAEDYKNHYIQQPLRALFGEKLPHFPESNWIERNNLAWIDRNDEAKEKLNEMISIPNVMPITPHSGAKLLERPKNCWVIYPFNTEEDEFDEIRDFLTSLSEFFYQRCGVGALDMSYPANKLTYGKLIVDSPMIFVRDPAKQDNFIETPLESGTLRVKSATEWGFKYVADNLERDIDGVMMDILERAYKPQNKADKIKSIYMHHYDDMDMLKRFWNGEESIHGKSLQKMGSYKDDATPAEIEAAIDKYLRENASILKDNLKDSNMQYKPQQLPDLDDKFKIFKKFWAKKKDEL